LTITRLRTKFRIRAERETIRLKKSRRKVKMEANSNRTMKKTMKKLRIKKRILTKSSSKRNLFSRRIKTSKTNPRIKKKLRNLAE